MLTSAANNGNRTLLRAATVVPTLLTASLPHRWCPYSELSSQPGPGLVGLAPVVGCGPVTPCDGLPAHVCLQATVASGARWTRTSVHRAPASMGDSACSAQTQPSTEASRLPSPAPSASDTLRVSYAAALRALRVSPPTPFQGSRSLGVRMQAWPCHTGCHLPESALLAGSQSP